MVALEKEIMTAGDNELNKIKDLEKQIRDMFKLEATRNDLNFALSGVECGEMTLQDYEDDLSVAISNWIVKDLLASQLEAIRSKMPEKEEYGSKVDKFNEWTIGFNEAIDEINKVLEDMK